MASSVHSDRALAGYRAVCRHQAEAPGDPADIRALCFTTIEDVLHYAVNEGAVAPGELREYIESAAVMVEMETGNAAS